MNPLKHISFYLKLGILSGWLWGGCWGLGLAWGQDSWLHFTFTAGDRLLTIDTKLWEPRENNQNTFSRMVTAQPMWINLVSLDQTHPLQAHDRVHVMILNYQHTLGRQTGENTSERILELDLEYVVDEHHGKLIPRFTGQVPPIIVAREYLPAYQKQDDFWQEVVFWINDRIYKDFANDHNFVFNVAEKARCVQLLR